MLLTRPNSILIIDIIMMVAIVLFAVEYKQLYFRLLWYW